MVYIAVIISFFICILIKTLFNCFVLNKKINNFLIPFKVNLITGYFKIPKVLFFTYILIILIIILDFIFFRGIISNYLYLINHTFCMEENFAQNQGENTDNAARLANIRTNLNRIRIEFDNELPTNLDDYINYARQLSNLSNERDNLVVQSVYGPLNLNYFEKWLNFSKFLTENNLKKNNPSFFLENFSKFSKEVVNINYENINTFNSKLIKVTNPLALDYRVIKYIFKFNIENIEKILEQYKLEPFADKLIIKYLNYYHNNFEYIDIIFKKLDIKKEFPYEIKNIIKNQLFNHKVYDIYNVRITFIDSLEIILKNYKKNFDIIKNFEQNNIPNNSNNLHTNTTQLLFNLDNKNLNLEYLLKLKYKSLYFSK